MSSNFAMKLSIVIPACGSQTDIDETLVSVLENIPANAEALLIHPRDYEDPYGLEDEVRLVASSGSDLLTLLNEGIESARGEVVQTLCPGASVSPGWSEHPLEMFEADHRIGSVAPMLFGDRNRRYIRGISYHVGAGKKIVSSARQPVTAPLLGSGFYLRRALQFMRGFDTRFSAWADIELGLRMKSAKYRCVTSESRVSVNRADFVHVEQGYQAGRVRGCLFENAKAFGYARSQVIAILTEPFRNGRGLGIFTGLAGRLTSRRLQPHVRPEETHESGSKLRAA